MSSDEDQNTSRRTQCRRRKQIKENMLGYSDESASEPESLTEEEILPAKRSRALSESSSCSSSSEAERSTSGSQSTGSSFSSSGNEVVVPQLVHQGSPATTPHRLSAQQSEESGSNSQQSLGFSDQDERAGGNFEPNDGNNPVQPPLRDIDENLAEFEDHIYVNDESEIESSDEDQSDDSSSDGEPETGEEDEDEPAAHQGLPGFDPPLYTGAPLTLGQSMLAILTFSVVHNLTGVALADLLSLVALHCIAADNKCKRTLYTFRKYFLNLKSPLKFHYFCSLCFSNLQSKDDRCQDCPSLSYRQNRVKKNPNNYEDVYDGRIFKEKVDEGILSNPLNLSFCWNSDGVKIWKSSILQVWPYYLVINNLPYRLRFKKENCVLAGLWIGSKPNVPLLLSSFHEDLSKLFTGVNFEVPGYNRQVTVKGIVLCGTCDMPAKALFLNMKQFNGYYGCPKCKIRGERSERTDNQHAYPFSNNVSRNMEETNHFADLAERYKTVIYGIKGRTSLGLYVADYIRSTSIDVLHCVYEGVTKKLIHLWFEVEYRNESFSLYNATNAIDQILVMLTPPSFVRRLPRSISDHLSHWKGQEYKSFLFYYSIPLLSSVMSPVYLQHHMLLVHGIFLLNQESISEEMITTAERCLKEYVMNFHELYAFKFLTINFHMLLHLGDVVRDLGPQWATSCMLFESLNGDIKRLVHGTRHALLQISSGLSQIVNLPILLAKLNDDDVIKKWCSELLARKRLNITEQITENVCTLGIYLKLNNVPPLIAAAIADAGIDGNVTQFFRLKKGKLIYYSLSYPRQTKTNSVFVKFSQNNETHFGSVHTFLKISQCACVKACQCLGEYYAVVQLYNVQQPFAIRNLNVPLSHIMTGLSVNHFTAVPVESLVTVCMFSEIQQITYIIEPVNTLEDE